MKVRGEYMITATWEQRKKLISNYEINKEGEIEKALETFSEIKKMAIKKYKLDEMRNDELEQVLFSLYIMQLENNKDELEKIIFLDYANNFINQISNQLMHMLQSIMPNTELKDNQHLFQTRYELFKKNQKITRDSFNKYFCSLENGVLVNHINGEETPLEEDYLEELKDKESDLFEDPNPKDPRIRSKHYLKKGNYDPKYWNGYIKFIEGQRKRILDYFIANEQTEDLDEFITIANIYYLYATYYKLTNELDNKKGKAL